MYHGYYQNQLTRKERAFSQPIYLLKVLPSTIEYEKKFTVVGTTNNKYTVTIGEDIKCTCPDFAQNSNICKHLYFIMLRVMKTNGSVRRKNKKETLLKYFSNMPHFLNDNIVYNTIARQNYEKQFKKEKLEQKIDDVCPICLVDLDNKTKKSNLYYCKYSCGKSVHKSCFEIWVNSGENNNKCIFCRAPWDNYDMEELDNSVGNDYS